MLRVIVAALGMAITFPAFGHGGGLDRCGGHNDRKRGGYHVHNQAKYCACNPKAKECSVPQTSKKSR